MSALPYQHSEISDLIVALADHDMTYADETLQMTIESIELESPVELFLQVGDNSIDIRTTPPLYYVETTFMPVFHQLRLTVKKDSSES